MTVAYNYQALGCIGGGCLRPVSAATVTVYLTGTLTRAALFDGFGNAISNPGIADQCGNFQFYIADGIYDIVATNGFFSVSTTTVGIFATRPLTSQYKLALNSWRAGSVDAIFQAVVQANEGDPTMIAWRASIAPPNGSFENLVWQWLQLATTASAPGPGLGMTPAAAAAAVIALRASANQQPV